jgi:WhiB family redox-sensing transcriptional regulator
MPTEWWFPMSQDQADSSDCLAAREICHTCPVRLECLQFALNSENDNWGIFGGLYPYERQKIRTGRTPTGRARWPR